MRKFDYKKIEKIIAENKDGLKEASIGMFEDFFWTAEIIWENGKYIEDIYSFSHLQESYWATPVILLRFKDKEPRVAEAFIGEKEGEYKNLDIFYDCMSGQNYEYMKSLKKLGDN